MNYRESAQEWAIRHRWMHSGLLSTLADVTEMPRHVLSNSPNDGNHLLGPPQHSCGRNGDAQACA